MLTLPCYPERDIRLASLEEDLTKLRAVEEDLQHSLNHKEEAVSQLKSQLEHQCLGEAALAPTPLLLLLQNIARRKPPKDHKD